MRYTTKQDYQDNAGAAIVAYKALSEVRATAHDWLMNYPDEELDFEDTDSVADALDRLGFYTMTGQNYYVLSDALTALEGIAGRSVIRSHDR